jgi:hypothetical protein
MSGASFMAMPAVKSEATGPSHVTASVLSWWRARCDHQGLDVAGLQAILRTLEVLRTEIGDEEVTVRVGADGWEVLYTSK